MIKDLWEKYTPLYFLASLGNGWLAVTFFMYLMFMTPHKDTPIPTFNSLITLFNSSEVYIKVFLLIAVLWIIYFAFNHLRLLFWNLKEYFAFKKTKAFNKLKSWNAEVTLMAMPLTLAMTINVMFILWAVFVPGLWGIVEYMFPFALIAFNMVWIFAIRIFWEYFTRLIVKWDFDFTANNNLSQLLAIFAFTMVWVGFAAPAAMSHNEIVAAIGLFGSTFFITISILLLLIKITLGFKSMFRNGLSREAAPSLWVIIPILTLIGISLVRQMHGYETSFDSEITKGSLFTLTSIIISLQIFFGYIGYIVMKKNDYFKDFVKGDKKSPGSFSLVCPWVAIMVFGFFFIHLGLVKTGLLDKFSIAYFIFLAPFIYLQLKTILVVSKLTKNNLK